MENTIYRINLEENKNKKIDLEFYICDTNELNPYRKIKELGIIILDNKKLQLDASLSEIELDSLIEYLIDCKKHIINFNKESKQIENEN